MQAVLRTVEDWAQAWSRTDADAYLAYYAPHFRTPKGEPRATWEAARRADFARLREVSVKVVSPQVTFRDQRHATVTFRQDYASATAKVTGRKTLELVREGERWLIAQETFVRR
jgi:ketosteroid isomerase-like protein